ncbi:MAG: dienelactone hydrolase family protein [Terriglobales bacterium]
MTTVRSNRASSDGSRSISTTVRISAGDAHLEGTLTIPGNARGLVLFAHGSGSSRLSPRNQYVAELLNEAGLATLLFDLLTPQEEIIDLRTTHLRFNIPLLAERMVKATQWVGGQEQVNGLSVGYYGASTGAAAALVAAAEMPGTVAAVVSRGGRPDLAGPALGRVRAATLLIVGGADLPVLEVNHRALQQMRCIRELAIVPGATHLFEEPGALEQVASLASRWFQQYLAGVAQSAA